MTVNNIPSSNPYNIAKTESNIDIKALSKVSELNNEAMKDSSSTILNSTFIIYQPNTINPTSLTESVSDNVNAYLRENNAMKAMNAYNASF